MGELKSVSGSRAEDLFIDLFADTFGAEKAGICIHNTRFSISIRMPVLPILSVKAERKGSPSR